MSNLTYLNDASVLHNLKQRYYHKLIYVRLFRKLETATTECCFFHCFFVFLSLHDVLSFFFFIFTLKESYWKKFCKDRRTEMWERKWIFTNFHSIVVAMKFFDLFRVWVSISEMNFKFLWFEINRLMIDRCFWRKIYFIILSVDFS